jgi:hypothetical protein
MKINNKISNILELEDRSGMLVFVNDDEIVCRETETIETYQ